MKKHIKILLSLYIILSTFQNLYSYQNNNSSFDGIKNDTISVSKSVKGLVFDIGYSFEGLSIAGGIRYGNFVFSAGRAGIQLVDRPFSFNPPPGIRFSLTENLPQGYSESSIVGASVFMDLSYYIGTLSQVSFFGTLGFFAQNDTLLAFENETGDYFYRGFTSKANVTFGGGIEWIYSTNSRFDLAFNTKKGVFLRYIYCWY